MKKQQIKAFTLVELIIVITILAILATIGFISYQSYTLDARDSGRKADLTQLSRGLEIYQTKNSVLPDPDAQTVTIMSGSNIISVQGYAGASVLQKLKATEMKDDSDNTYYTYTVNGDKTRYQLLSMLENNTNLASTNNILNEAYAINYSSRYPYTKGNKVGVFFSGTTNIPLQETTSGSIDLAGAYSGTNFKVMFANSISNSGIISSTGVNLPAQIQTITNSTASTSTVAVNPGVKTTGFSTTLYSGNGSTQSITTGVDMSSQWGTDPSQKFGGLVWTKGRNYISNNAFYDTVRGPTNRVLANATNIQDSISGLTSFTSNGFNLGSHVDSNNNTSTYTSWVFQTTNISSGTTNQGKNYTCQYNPYTGFTIVKYVGSGLSGHEIPTCLGRKLSFNIIKSLSSTYDWVAQKEDNFGGYINTTAAFTDLSANMVTNRNATSLVLGVNSYINALNQTFILYGWANSYLDGSNMLIGNYEWVTWQGTGTSGNKVTTKGKPAAIIFAKRLDALSDWWCEDNVRGMGNVLFPSLSSVESAAYGTDINFANDGFILSNNHAISNVSGAQYGALVVYDNDNRSGKSTYMLK